MIVALHDSDATAFPNLALMKLAAHHRAAGDEVRWFSALERNQYGHVYSSKVFTFTAPDPYLPDDTIMGGTGYGGSDELPESIEHRMPDYGLYRLTYSVGFLTRGCPRRCEWCFVPAKEGDIRPHADIEEFAAHRDVVLLDNNVLASPHGLAQIEKVARLGLRVDFNQGLDARLIDDAVARRLAKVRWLAPVRMACDHKGQLPAIRRAVEALRWHNVVPRKYFVYALIRDVGEALERIRVLKGLDLDVFAQPFIPPDGGQPTAEQRALARWCNHKAENRSRTWEDYAAAHGVAA
jgi:hypothetical protein